MMFLGFERRWIAVTLASFAPPGGEGLSPEPGEIDWVDAADTMISRSTFGARVGYRVALWLVALSPMWFLSRAIPFGSLPITERSEILAELLRHRHLVVRGLALMLKLTATLAMFRSPTLRSRSNYDRRERDTEASEASGRRRRALRVVVSREDAA